MSWASLFSGGKDSSWALYQALEAELDVSHLVTVHPHEESFMYHVPATRLARLAAESVDLPLIEVGVDFDDEQTHDSGARGDAELEPLEAALLDLDESLDDGLTGVTAGAIESEYQTSRIEGMCERLGIDLFAPLWQADPMVLGEQMLADGFEIRIVQVAADGLDESWLGRRLDADALAELEELAESRGVHVLGEGGEFETLVVDGPHMDRSIEIEAEPHWDGVRGHLEIRDAWLASGGN